MTSHIFVAMGMWDDVVAANETAVKITGGVAAPGRPPASCGHYPTWLMYGYLQQGRIETARNMVKACHATGGASADASSNTNPTGPDAASRRRPLSPV